MKLKNSALIARFCFVNLAILFISKTYRLQDIKANDTIINSDTKLSYSEITSLEDLNSGLILSPDGLSKYMLLKDNNDYNLIYLNKDLSLESELKSETGLSIEDMNYFIKDAVYDFNNDEYILADTNLFFTIIDSISTNNSTVTSIADSLGIESTDETLNDTYNIASNYLLKVKYQEAQAFFEAKDFISAIQNYMQVGNYLDSNDKLLECYYYQAQVYFDNKDFQQAIDNYIKLGNYLDSNDKLLECYYYQGQAYFDNKDFEHAVTYFEQAQNFSDSEQMVLNSNDEIGTIYLNNNDSDNAIIYFTKAQNTEKVQEIKNSISQNIYNQAENSLSDKDYDKSIELFNQIIDYSDSESRIQQIYDELYKMAEEYLKNEDYDNASLYFTKANAEHKLADVETAKNTLNNLKTFNALSAKEKMISSTDSIIVSNISDIFSKSIVNVSGIQDGGWVVNTLDTIPSLRDYHIVKLQPSQVSPFDAGLVGLTLDGKVVTEKDNSNINLSNFTDIIDISTSSYGILGLKKDGSVIISSDSYDNLFNTQNWTNIKRIYSSTNIAIGIKNNNTVVATFIDYNPSSYYYQTFDSMFNRVNSWTDIVDIAVYNDNNCAVIVGVKSNGSVISASTWINNDDYSKSETIFEFELGSDWNNIAAVSITGKSDYTDDSNFTPYSKVNIVGLKENGTVVHSGIQGFSVEKKSLFSTTTNLEVYAYYSSVMSSEIKNWSDITAICTAIDYIVGVKSNGDVIIASERSEDYTMFINNIFDIKR